MRLCRGKIVYRPHTSIKCIQIVKLFLQSIKCSNYIEKLYSFYSCFMNEVVSVYKLRKQVCLVVAFLVKWENPTEAYTKNEYTVEREAVGQLCMSAAIRTAVRESSSWQMCAVSWALCGFVLQVECRQISFNRWQNNVHCMLGGKGHISLCLQRMSVGFNQLREENELLRCSEKNWMSQMEILFSFFPRTWKKRKELLVNSKTCSIFRKFQVRYVLEL